MSALARVLPFIATVGVALLLAPLSMPVSGAIISTIRQTLQIRAATPYDLTWPAATGHGALVNGGTGTLAWGGCHTLEVDTTQNATDDGTLETLVSYTIPADTLDANNDTIVVHAYGTLAADTDSKIIDIDFDSTTAVTVTTALAGTTAFAARLEVVRTAAGAQKVFGIITPLPQAAGAAVAMGGSYSTDAADETGTINIDLTADGVNANDVVFEFWRVLHCPA